MAARENQGLQIALILSCLLAMVLAVTTFMFYRTSDEKVKETEAAKKDAAAEKSAAEAHRNATELLKAMLGASTKSAPELDNARKALEAGPVKDLAADVKKIEEQFNKDMLSFAADSQEKNYVALPQQMALVINQKSGDLADAKRRVQDLTDERKTAVDAEQAKTKAAQQELQSAIAAKEDLAKQFEGERTRFISESAGHAKTAADRASELKAKTDDFTKDKTTLEGNFKTSQNLAKSLAEKLRLVGEPSYEVPDGKITHVNQRSNVVWINLGSADGLRRQVTFSVFDQKATNLKTETAKGSIEVTRIIDEHLAECRIVSSNVGDPLMQGDLAFSPVWQPGQTLHFAIAGEIDYNNDGKSDTEVVKNVIRMNGGVIDLEVGADGKIVGPGMTVDTRYLIMGKRPDEKSAEKGAEALSGYSKVLTEAEYMGVQQLSVANLLDMMGYKGEAKTKGMGKGASSDDYKAKASDGVIRKSDAPTAFQKRTP